MSILLLITLTTMGGGLAAAGVAVLLTREAEAAHIPLLVSFAVGALLGAVFLEILPHAFEHPGQGGRVGGALLAGTIAFFALEKLVLWRHHHHGGHSHGETQPQTNGPAEPLQRRSAVMILIGNGVHNFVDGILIAAAFLTDVRIGLATALAIVSHEIPQSLGDFLILLHSGMPRRRALGLNLLCGAALSVGGVAGFFALGAVSDWMPALLGFAAASMIYVAVADLIPGLHQRRELSVTVQQVALILLGVATVVVVPLLAGQHG